MKKPIGIFDSGIGGLTVLREITLQIPGADTVYLGDTARVPYGNKSRETVLRYSRQVAEFLLSQDVGLIVVACNTASAYAVDVLSGELPVPVVGVVEPGARAAASVTRNGLVGVIGTEGTIRSSAYTGAIKAVNPGIETFPKACPLFVPLAEEGWSDTDIARMVAERYLSEMKSSGIDTLVLGCTHYPLLKHTITEVMGPDITLIDSAEATAAEVKKVLGAPNTAAGGTPNHRYFATDSPERFARIGGMFFGEKLTGAELARLEPETL